jgi:hypothetical protein
MERPMIGVISQLEVSLRAHDLFDIQDGEGLSVTCRNGVVWITQSNDARDVVIAAGESFTLDRPGLALVAAPNGPASITVRKAEIDADNVMMEVLAAPTLSAAA